MLDQILLFLCLVWNGPSSGHERSPWTGLEANYTPFTGPFVPGVKVTPEFYPLVLTKNYGVKNGGIQYSVYFPGVTSTLFCRIQEYILPHFLLLFVAFAAASKTTRFYTTIRCNFYTERKTSPVDCSRSCFLQLCP